MTKTALQFTEEPSTDAMLTTQRNAARTKQHRVSNLDSMMYYQPRSVTESQADLTALQRDIFMCLMKAIHDKFPYRDRRKPLQFLPYAKDDIEIELPVHIIKGENPARIIKAAEALGTKRITFKTTDPDNGEDIFVSTPLLTIITYRKKRNIITVEVPFETRQKFAEFLFRLGKNFTKIDLKIGISFNSKYSKKLYEIICHARKRKAPLIYSLQEFKEMLGVKNSYPKITEFKKNVLDIAQVELNEKAGIEFKYKLYASKESQDHVDKRQVKIDTIKITNVDDKNTVNQWLTESKAEDYVFNFIEHFKEEHWKSSNHLVDILKVNNYLMKISKRFHELGQDFDRQEKSRKDIQSLISYILKEDFQIKLVKNQTSPNPN